MKLRIVEAILIAIALFCALEIAYLAWLSATPITAEHLSAIKVELSVVVTLLVIVIGIAIGLPRFWRKR